MKKPYHLLIPVLFIFFSCHNSSNDVKLIDGPKFGVNKGKPDQADFSGPNRTGSPAAGVDATQGAAFNGLNLASAASASRKIEPEVVAEELPRSYKQRKFLTDLSGLESNLFMIPGNIVRFNPKDTTYQFRTLRAITKGGKPPIVSTISDGAIYSAKITSSTSFNGSYLIIGLNVNKDETMELNIQDVASSTVPDSLVDVEAIRGAIANIPDDQKKDLYYIKAATLTYIDSRKYTEAKFDASINSCFVTAGGKTYSSNEKFKRDKTVAIFIVPLDNIISTH
jgi:hypothetical protein